MPRLEIEWESAGHPEQDEALMDEIADFVFPLLNGYDPVMTGELGTNDAWQGRVADPAEGSAK